MIADLDEDRHVELVAASRRPPYLLAEAWRDYLGEHALRKGQELRRVRYTAKHWLRVMDAGSEVATWRRADTARYEDVRRGEGVMGTTIRREMCLQQAVLNHAKKYERIEKIPHFEKPSGQGSVRRPMTEEEFARLMRSPMPRRVRMFYLLAYHTGHRARAIETLPWERVDLERGTIDFNEPGARRTNKNWAKCKKCGARVQRRPLPENNAGEDEKGGKGDDAPGNFSQAKPGDKSPTGASDGIAEASSSEAAPDRARGGRQELHLRAHEHPPRMGSGGRGQV